ncbi:uncharacterized protein LOC110980781 [Acanthaster planci]|uniref:Uncharacterized protein LOC110980781 n=1 Tax=Acanthaster planci TaxID=133434 RepID=A0A8B7YJJ7_ACAPL|nr:uncharacterized protein LOC110980781 [Acanthaster planci]
METTRRTSVRSCPPTQGSIWAIFIVVAAHINLALVGCSLRTTEVFYLRWREEFETSAKQTAAVQSIAWSLSCSCGLIGGLMIKRFSCRVTGIVGGLLAVTGVFGSAWVRSISQLYITTIIHGVGSGIIVNASVVAVAQNFKRRFRTAHALAHSGCGMGYMVGPPLVQSLLADYGWRGGLLIISAIMANTVAFALLFRPPRMLEKAEQDANSHEKLSWEKEEHFSKEQTHPAQENGAEAERGINTETPYGTRDVRDAEMNYSEMRRSAENGNLRTHALLESNHTEPRPEVNLLKRIASALELDVFRKSYRFSLLCLLAIATAIPFLGHGPFIIPRAQNIGVAPSEAALQLTLNGIGSLLGRLGNGLVISWKLSSEIVCFICAAVAGTSLFLMNVDSHACLSVASFLLGLSSGMSYSVFIVITRHYVGSGKFSVCLGIYYICVGTGGLLGAVTAGWVFDVTASYKAVFYVLGGITFACAVVMFLFPVLKRVEPGIDLNRSRNHAINDTTFVNTGQGEPGSHDDDVPKIKLAMATSRMTSVRSCPPTRDSIWAIAIVIAAHLNFALVECCLRANDVLYLSWRNEFETSAKQTAAVQSIMSSLTFCSGLIGGLMVKRFGCRMTGIVGELLAVLGVFGSVWVRSIYQLYITAALNGVGLGIVLNASLVAVAQKFNQRYRMANALTYSGCGMGKMAAPPLVQFLLDSYGWRGALLIISAMMANTIALTLLFRPTPLEKTELNANSNKDFLSLEKEENSLEGQTQAEQENGGEVATATEAATSPATLDADMNDYELYTSSQQRNVRTYTPPQTVKSDKRLKVPLLSRVTSALGLDVFRKSYRFGLLCLVSIVSAIPYCGSTPFIIPRALSFGVTPPSAASMLTVNGIGVLVGHLSNGLLIGGKLSAEIVCSGCAAVAGASLLLMNADSYACFSVGSFLLGLSTGVMYAVFIVLTRKYVESRQFSVCLGIYYICSGIGGLLGPVTAGWVFDISTSYKTVYYVLGGIEFGCAILMFLFPVLKRVEPGKDFESTEA